MAEQLHTRSAWPQGPEWCRASQSSYIDSPLWLLRTLEDDWITIEVNGEDTMQWPFRQGLNRKNQVLRFDWQEWDMRDLNMHRAMLQTAYVTYMQYVSIIDRGLAPVEIQRGGDMGSAEDFLNWATQDLKDFSLCYRKAHMCTAADCGLVQVGDIIIPQQRVLVASSKTVHMFHLENTEMSAYHQVLQSTFRFSEGALIRLCDDCGTLLEQAWLVQGRLPRYLMVTSPWQGDLVLRTAVQYHGFDMQQRTATYQMSGLVCHKSGHFKAWRVTCKDDGTFQEATRYDDMQPGQMRVTQEEFFVRQLIDHNVIVILTKIDDIEHIDPIKREAMEEEKAHDEHKGGDMYIADKKEVDRDDGEEE